MPNPDQSEDIRALAAAVKRGERRAISRAVTEAERGGPVMAGLIRAFGASLGRAAVIGFTGPPGAGKSTLVNAYVSHLRHGGRTVGILAVDPSSPVSGGAILGDRIRMSASLDDPGVFMRSLASRGALGGLSPAAVRAIDALDGAGMDVIVLETVGTGQNEIDVAEVADVRVVLAAPGLGDGIQAMKAGLLEIADILVVNKADRPGAEETLQQLLGALALRSGPRDSVAVLKTAAVAGTGVPELADAIERLAAARMQTAPQDRRRRRARYLVARAAAELVAARIRRGDRRLDALADDVLAGSMSPDAAAAAFLDQD
jgi:LAO/AO transport system kinase